MSNLRRVRQSNSLPYPAFMDWKSECFSFVFWSLFAYLTVDFRNFKSSLRIVVQFLKQLSQSDERTKLKKSIANNLKRDVCYDGLIYAREATP